MTSCAFGAKCMYAALPPRIYGSLVFFPFVNGAKGALSPLSTLLWVNARLSVIHQNDLLALRCCVINIRLLLTTKCKMQSLNFLLVFLIIELFIIFYKTKKISLFSFVGNNEHKIKFVSS